jgi:hypothetical protein
VDIANVTKEFISLPGAAISEASSLYTDAKPWEEAVSILVSRFPGLARYPDYLWFLSKVGGASLMYDPPTSDDYVLLQIYGFGEFGEKTEADEHGFLGFAEIQARYSPYVHSHNFYDGCVWRVFALDANGGHAPVVFAPASSQDQVCMPRWSTFSAWLTEVVTTRGKLPL